MGLRVYIFCGNSSTILKKTPNRDEVEEVLSACCRKCDDNGATAADKIAKALNEHFPVGWNCVRVDIKKKLVVSFTQTDLENVLRFDHSTEKSRFVVWAWIA